MLGTVVSVVHSNGELLATYCPQGPVDKESPCLHRLSQASRLADGINQGLIGGQVLESCLHELYASAVCEIGSLSLLLHLKT